MKPRNLATCLAIAAAVLSAPLRATAQPECDKPASSVRADVGPEPLADNLIPPLPQLFRDAGVEGAVRVRLVVGVDGRPEPGGICPDSEWDQLEDAVRQVAGGWRFNPARRGGRPVRAVYEAEFRYSARDTIRHTSLRPLTLRHLTGRDSAGIVIVVVPSWSAAHGPGALRPADAVTRATRDSAELAMLLQMVSTRPAHGAACVRTESEWVLDRLRESRPGVADPEACTRPGQETTVYRVNWTGPVAGVTRDGGLFAPAGVLFTAAEACNPGPFCGSGTTTTYACEAARDRAGWIALCRFEASRMWVASGSRSPIERSSFLNALAVAGRG